MKINLKQLLAATFLLAGSTFISNAQLLPGGPGISGTAILADHAGVNTPPEALTVYWSVTESLANVYTYTYTVSNAPLDVVLSGPLTGQPEIVENFAVQFNTSIPNSVIGSPTGGNFGFSIPGLGIDWSLPAVAAGTESGPLSFQSDYAPILGRATASDGNLPSPWASYPYGTPVPVPNVPDSGTTMALLSGVSLVGWLVRRRFNA